MKKIYKKRIKIALDGRPTFMPLSLAAKEKNHVACKSHK